MVAVTPVARGRAGLAARGVGVVTVTRHHHPPTPGHPADVSGGSDPDSLIALERAGAPTAELIARAQAHLDTLHRAHPHLRPVPDPAPGPDTHAWYGFHPDPLTPNDRDRDRGRGHDHDRDRDHDRRRDQRDRDAAELAELAAQVATLWTEFRALLHHVAALTITTDQHTTQLADHTTQLTRRPKPPRPAR